MSLLTEDTLVQQTTAEYLRDEPGWETVCAYNNETFSESTKYERRSANDKAEEARTTKGEVRAVNLGRASDREVVLVRYLRLALEKLNPGLPADAYDSAVRQLVEYNAAQSLLAVNEEKYALVELKGVRKRFD